MQRTATTAFALALTLGLGACAGSETPDTSAAPVSTTATIAVPPTTITSEPAPDPSTDTTPSSLALSDVALATGPSVVFLDDDVEIETVVYQLTLEAETDWELPIHIAVPSEWTFDAENGSFSNGASAITLETGCSADCAPTAWDVTLQHDGEFLADPFADIADGGQELWGSGTSSETGYSTRARTFDDGSGRSRTGHFSYSGGRWLGCTADASSGDTVDVDTLGALCEAIEADWSTVIGNTAPPTIEQRSTPAIDKILLDPSIGVAGQVIPLDVDGTHNVLMQLPADGSFDVDEFWGTEIEPGADFSIFTDMALDAACDGICAGQDWEEKINSVTGEIGRIRAAVDVENDIAIDSGWLISGSSGDGDQRGTVVRWDDDADHYFSCSIEADARDADHITDLLRLCLTAQPDWFGK